MLSVLVCQNTLGTKREAQAKNRGESRGGGAQRMKVQASQDDLCVWARRDQGLREKQLEQKWGYLNTVG